MKKIVLLIIMSSFVFLTLGQTKIIELNDKNWDLSKAEIKEKFGRRAAKGEVVLKDVIFKNGIIEFDINMNGKRTFPGVKFRTQNDNSYEYFYIRPHHANGIFRDALQYAPSYKGTVGWQLYNGKGFTSAIHCNFNEWINVKLEIKESQARVFINDSLALEIPELQLGGVSGGIALQTRMDDAAWFSNFKYTETNDLIFEKKKEKFIPIGIFTDWEISQVFKHSKIDYEKYPTQPEIKQIEWRKVKSDNTGMVDISKHHPRSTREPEWVYAKRTIESDKDQTMKLSFGYSDYISVFLNGQLYFMGNSAFKSRHENFVGVVSLHDNLYLPLKKGKNELLLMIGESMGGWGFMCKNSNATFEHAMLTKKWEIPNKLKYPESVVYDSENEVLYASNNYADGKEFISKIGLNGEIIKLDWINNIEGPTGMVIYKRKLFVVDRRNVVEIDINKEKIIKKHPIPEAAFPNDIAVSKKGEMYITDSQTGVIYKFKKGKIEVWLKSDEINQPNGICFDDDRIIVGSNTDGSLKSVDLKTKEVSTILKLEGNNVLDGINLTKDKSILFSNYNGQVFKLSKNNKLTKLIDFTAQKITCADFEYIESKNLLIIPTLYNNNILTYELNKN